MKQNTLSSIFSPREIVSELDRFIIGQNAAKKSVAIALRNRWRRQNVQPESLRNEIQPKNILMIGPTGVGKTEIARRLAKLAQAPFVKVEATKFTEVGYVGRDVESIIRDLVEIAIKEVRKTQMDHVQSKAHHNVEKRILNSLVGETASKETRLTFKTKLRSQELDDKEIEIELKEIPSYSNPTFDIPGMPGAQMGLLNLSDMLGKGFMPTKTVRRKVLIPEAQKLLIKEESEKLINEEEITQIALKKVQDNGIVFIDEIDKICSRQDKGTGNVSREGVQRDLLPIIEGSTVNTKYGSVQTDHILFIASGAFHTAKPSDLLPELQGRLPIRVELSNLTKEDFYRILTETEASLILQYTALLKTENIHLEFSKEALQKISLLAQDLNQTVENIGARRLHTLLELVLEDINFTATDRSGETIQISESDVQKKLGHLEDQNDLSKFIL